MSGSTRITVEQMNAHVLDLCERYQIAIVWTKRAAWALREAEEIQIPPIRGPVSYAIALHEIGHIRGRHQTSPVRLVRERWAWRWARCEARMWTPAMERSREGCLRWYEKRARRPGILARDKRDFETVRRENEARMREALAAAGYSA